MAHDVAAIFVWRAKLATQYVEIFTYSYCDEGIRSCNFDNHCVLTAIAAFGHYRNAVRAVISRVIS